MPLTLEQMQTIINIDKDANKIISKEGDNEELLITLYPIMNDLKKIMDSSSHDELNEYCQRYDGFYQYMKLLESLAQKISAEKYMFNLDSKHKL